jgi:hypothetical protein
MDGRGPPKGSCADSVIACRMIELWILLARLNARLVVLAWAAVGVTWPREADPHDLTVLGLDQLPSSARDLQKAYRSAARKTHPDVAGGSREAFLAITAAFERLSTVRSGRKV